MRLSRLKVPISTSLRDGKGDTILDSHKYELEFVLCHQNCRYFVHSNLTTTQIYTHIVDESLEGALQSFRCAKVAA
jgi:hypothetical protein